MVNENVNLLVTKIENIINIWSKRDLTVVGKISIIKAHLQSRHIYQLSVQHSPPLALFDKIEKRLFKYMWFNKPDRIK